MQNDRRRSGVQAIARSAAVLRAVAKTPEGVTLGEIAAEAGLAKSTAHRILAALADEELVAEGSDGRHRLGPEILRLGSAAHEALGERLRPILLALRRELDETVDLAVLDGSSARFVEQLAAPRRLRAVSAVGESFPLHCTANGKALLAALPEEEAGALLPARLPRLTPQTITARSELLAELERVRLMGVAYDREEHSEGICAIGAAVAGAGTPAAAAISVPVPSQRFAAAEERVAAAVRKAAVEASVLLGGSRTAI